MTKELSSPWYRQRWPWILMAGPFFVVIAGSFTAWLAITKSDALVVGDYYKQGKAINQDLRRDQVATSLGMALTLRYDPAAGRLTGKVEGQSLAPVRLHLVHSTQPEKDLHLLVRPDAQGEFSIGLPMLELARWTVLAEGEARDWRLAGTWRWPQQGEISLHADALL